MNILILKEDGIGDAIIVYTYFSILPCDVIGCAGRKISLFDYYTQFMTEPSALSCREVCVHTVSGHAYRLPASGRWGSI